MASENQLSLLDTTDSEGNLNYKVISNLAYKSQAGVNDEGMIKINQDSYVMAEGLFGLENYNIYGVLDGHGMLFYNSIGNNGHQVSSFINVHFCDYFMKKENYFGKKQNPTVDLKTEKSTYDHLRENKFEAIRTAFNSAEAILTKAKYDVNFSGSTSVVVFMIGNRVVCANAGDSRAILVREISI
jgi:serine/threonine protein phosphatase PrpC